MPGGITGCEPTQLPDLASEVKELHGIRSARSLVVAILAFIVLAAPSVVLADGRVALVVGNSTYAHIGRLPNPENDAADMSAVPAAARVRGDDRAGRRRFAASWFRRCC